MDPDNFDMNNADSELYDSLWVEDYGVAKTKVVLGLIRRKFSNFSALGNQGTGMDGSDLVSEGKEEMERLEEQLMSREVHLGWPIMCA